MLDIELLMSGIHEKHGGQPLPGGLLEAGTRVPAPVYSEYSTRLHKNEVLSGQIEDLSKLRLTETSFHNSPALLA